ncbi:MAG: TIGR01244 family phosphatase [Porticoccaceae bacterium]|nr:TIGR01244 family phosphatase [Porticoccaceae bacterium]
MQPKYLDDDIAVLPQIDPSDVAGLADMGFKTIVSNRPDNEEPGQPTTAAVEQAAADAGVVFKSQPVTSGAITFNDVADFKEIVDEAEKPVLAFCRSGTRCTMLWALSSAGHTPTEAIMASADAAGYNLEGLRRQLEALAAAEQ